MTVLDDIRPAQVEIEFTGACNASCTVCPRDNMPRFRTMSEATLGRVIDFYRSDLGDGREMPDCVVAGGGEPFLHKGAADMLSTLIQAGFRTSVSTNVSRVDDRLAVKIASLGLERVYVSFWGIEAAEYQAAMGLPFQRSLDNVLNLHQRLVGSRTELLVKWVTIPEILSTDDEIEAFWAQRGVQTVKGYRDVWNRGGLLEAPPGSNVQPPDPSKRIWCVDVQFADAIAATGEVILCCCHYFNKHRVSFGNISDIDPSTLRARKAQFMRQLEMPVGCRTCTLPRASRAANLTRRVADRFSAEEREMILAY